VDWLKAVTSIVCMNLLLRTNATNWLHVQPQPIIVAKQ